MADERLAVARGVFVATLPAARPECRLALLVVLVSGVIFLSTAPFAKLPLTPVWPFIPIYQSALALNDLITAVLLFGQFAFLRSRALLILASGYLFTAAMAILHMLTFPGLFAPTGLLGAGPQTTAWLFMFWHAGFPVCVMAYALFKGSSRERSHYAAGAIVLGCAAALVAAGALMVLATAGQAGLPTIMRGNHYTPAMLAVVSSVWSMSLIALALLWARRPHSVLDVWLMVVMAAWIFDIALAAVLNGGRFDLGFYAGRIYGLFAASYVLMVLLLEHTRLYARLVDAHEALAAQNRSLDRTVKERTERLLQSEKLATMGSLLAGVAHELNNPLAALSGQAQLLLLTQRDPAVVAQRAAKITDAVGRCVRIVRNFLALARQQPPERKATQLAQVIDGAVELLAYELKSDGVEMTVHVASDVPVMWADAHQLHQLFVNLINNAQHAMRRQPAPRRIAIAVRFVAQTHRVHIEVRDTGPGIPPEIQRRVFEPFFTTKPQGEGTGLGLSLCAGIVQDHGGIMTLESTPGAGAAFHIEVPVVKPPQAAAVEGAMSAPPLAPQRLLVVDDEVSVGEALAEALQRDGHAVDVAPNGTRALELLAAARYDAIISDTKMPSLDGEGFYAEVLRRFPRLRGRIVFVTGDVLSNEKRAFLDSTGAPFVFKPYDFDDVRHALRRVVSGEKTS
jgi:signal transduction histidine kinase/ActR/RegA family two-component response regulator